MSKILLVTSSPRAEASLSTKLATELATKLQTPDGELVHRDLGASPLPHIDSVFASAIRKPADTRTPEEAEAAVISDQMVDELLAADTLIIGTGLINFGINSQLKSWIDHIARAGLTFKYTENGPIGLATGTKAYIVLASGGIYSEGPSAANDHAVPYLKTVLAFMGITNVETIYLEGVAFGPDAAEKAIAAATARAAELALAA